MKSRNKVLLIFALLIVVISLTISSTYAWYFYSNKTNPILISSGSLKISSALYVENTENNLKDGNIENITDWNNLNEEYQLDNAIPGEIYSFKLDVKNRGTIDGYLSLSLINIYVLTNNTDETDDSVLNHIQVKCLDQNLNIIKDFNKINERIFNNGVESDITYYANTLFINNILPADSQSTFYFQIKIMGESVSDDTLSGYSIRIGNVYTILDQTMNQINQ